nr:glycine betaine ABC transporter substrate-binding protein [Tomitella biformata]
MCAALLASCGLQSGSALPLSVDPGSIVPVEGLEGASLTVGSKDFTENIVLGYITAFALSAAGADVRDMTNIQGSNSARDAMLAGQVDVYVEYTGTGWINYLHNEQPIKDSTEQFDAVRDQDLKVNDVVWVDPAPLDNTYAIATNQATAAETGVKTVSDYAALITANPGKYSTCLETEFNSRQDGYPGMAAAYGFNPDATDKKILQTGIIYQATAAGSECQFGEVFTTDGRIKGLDLVVLEDDKSFFPHYNAALTMLSKTNDAYPQIATVLKPVMAKITSDEIAAMNTRVDVDGIEPSDVAREWLADNGFVTIP